MWSEPILSLMRNHGRRIISEYNGLYEVQPRVYARIVVTVFVTYWSSVPSIVIFSPSPYFSPFLSGLSYEYIFVYSTARLLCHPFPEG